ncbi:MAG: hypothetical protein EXR71_11720 [Myxococcales bacterium]|nr:hypothetical protein [Myxococcales bacterium]
MAVPLPSRWRDAWVGPLVAAVHALPADAGRLGVWRDDAMYANMAESLGRGGPIVADCLPGAPGMAKYPLGFPALLALFRALGLGWDAVLWMQAMLWGVAAQVVVSGLLRRLGASPRARVAVGLLLAVNTVSFGLVPQVMSEPAFTLVLVSLATLVLDPLPTRRTLFGVLALTFALGALRGAGSLYALAGGLVALSTGRRALAGALGAGWALTGLLAQLQRLLTPEPPAELATLLRYYVSYDVHSGWYAQRFAEGGVGAVVAGVTRVVAANLGVGLRSLGQYLSPEAYVGAESPGSGTRELVLGAALLGLALLGAWRHARPLAVLLVVHTAVFLAWTWPFSGRFWLPMIPLLFALAVRFADGARSWSARVLFWPMLGLVLVGNTFVPAYTAKGRFLGGGAQDATTAAEEEGLVAGVAALRARVAPGDVLVGELSVFWMARELGLQAVVARDLVPFDDALAALMGWRTPGADRTRLSGLFAANLTTLRRLTPAGADVWVVLDPSRADEKRMWIEEARDAGQVEPVGRFGSLWLGRVVSQTE